MEKSTICLACLCFLPRVGVLSIWAVLGAGEEAVPEATDPLVGEVDRPDAGNSTDEDQAEADDPDDEDEDEDGDEARGGAAGDWNARMVFTGGGAVFESTCKNEGGPPPFGFPLAFPFATLLCG